jgi:regulator of protease activity HflC (stomatin/prohibitin superfamily)
MFSFIFLIFILAIGLAVCSSCFVVVRQQTVAVVETLGKFSQTLPAGLHIILPRPISRVVHVAQLRIREIKTEVEVKTADNMFVKIPAALMIQVSEKHVHDSYYKLGNPVEQMGRWIINTLRSVAASMKLEDLYTDREKIVKEVTEHLASKALEFGYRIEGVLVDQPTVPTDVQHSFNRVVASEREREAAKQEAEANRIRIVAAAEAESEGQIRRAEGLAKSRKILVDSLEENIKTIRDTGANVEAAMDLLLQVNRLDTIRDASHNKNLILMDLRDPNAGIQAALLRSNPAK